MQEPQNARERIELDSNRRTFNFFQHLSNDSYSKRAFVILSHLMPLEDRNDGKRIHFLSVDHSKKK